MRVLKWISNTPRTTAQLLRTAKYFRFYLSQVKHSQRRGLAKKEGSVYLLYIKIIPRFCFFQTGFHTHTKHISNGWKKTNHIQSKHRLTHRFNAMSLPGRADYSFGLAWKRDARIYERIRILTTKSNGFEIQKVKNHKA